jgi:hypothetical protein
MASLLFQDRGFLLSGRVVLEDLSHTTFKENSLIYLSLWKFEPLRSPSSQEFRFFIVDMFACWSFIGRFRISEVSRSISCRPHECKLRCSLLKTDCSPARIQDRGFELLHDIFSKFSELSSRWICDFEGFELQNRHIYIKTVD